MAQAPTVAHASVRPNASLNLLSRLEAQNLATADHDVHQLFRRCALAVLNTGSETDDARQVYADYPDFDVEVVQESRGLRIELHNAPAAAFVDGVMIHGIREHLFTTLRDIVFIAQRMQQHRFDLDSGSGITDTVFRILRNANIVRPEVPPRAVVCWGGHSISREEYEFSKEVGYQMGLRHLDIVTGCGQGAMKGPMKGAGVGHAKQSNRDGRFIGITEPDIIASESPNPIVNELVILPDIEKRLEAFVRLAHAIVVFPGGVGTAEEILYLLCIKMQPENQDFPLPVILAAPEVCANYVEEVDAFLRGVLGDSVAEHYRVIIGDAAAVARESRAGIATLRRYRRRHRQSYSFNWDLVIPESLQRPFVPTHENMAALDLSRELPAHHLASELRKAFSGIVAGNIKDSGIRAVEDNGPFILKGDAVVADWLDRLLAGFVRQGRMKLDASGYRPCYSLAGK